MSPVLVVGDLMTDVVALHRGPVAAGSDTAARIRTVGGGSAANTACWLGSLGEPVQLLAAVGDDPLGSVATDEVARCGVEWIGPTVSGSTTGTCIVLVDGGGERTMLPDRGANDDLDVASVHGALAERPSWVHVSAYALLDEGSRAAGRAAIDGALQADTVVSVDVASSAPLQAVGPDRVRAWLAGVDVVFANEGELAALGGLEDLRSVVGSVVVKRGAAGATWLGARDRADRKAPSVAAVDTTGAGDALAAGWIAARRGGAGPAEALHQAVALGARATTVTGARPAPGDRGTRP